MSKYEILPKEVPRRAVLTGTMWDNGGEVRKMALKSMGS